MIFIKENDRRPYATTVLRRGKVLVNLSGATGVTFRMRDRRESAIKVEAAAVITDAPNGAIQYQWAAADTDTPGTYFAEWTVTFPTAEPETFPSIGYDIVIIEARLNP